MEAVFDALGDPTRRRILEVLAGSEQPAGAVVDALRAGQAISQPAVSQHLKILREAGLMSVRAEGTRRYYSVDRRGLQVARAWLDRVAAPAAPADPAGPFAQALDALATEVARGQRRARRDETSEQPGTAATA